MTPSADFLSRCRAVLAAVEAQQTGIQQAAGWFADTILAGRMVHLFGSGHSRIMVEEMWPRYGSFPGFNPIVELSLSFHNPVVGANGQRQAMFLENVSGLGELGGRAHIDDRVEAVEPVEAHGKIIWLGRHETNEPDESTN